MDNPKVKAYFQTLDVDVHEGGTFNIGPEVSMSSHVVARSLDSVSLCCLSCALLFQFCSYRL